MKNFKVNDVVLYTVGAFKRCIVLATRRRPIITAGGTEAVPSGYDYLITNQYGDVKELIPVKKQHLIPVSGDDLY